MTRSLGDPDIGIPYPRAPEDPRAFFAAWMQGGTRSSFDELNFFTFLASWWGERYRPNVLMVHYNDLKGDLAAEIAHVAAFLGIVHPERLMAEIVEAASFSAMQRYGDALAPFARDVWEGGKQCFLHKSHEPMLARVLTSQDLPTMRHSPSYRRGAACGSNLMAGSMVDVTKNEARVTKVRVVSLGVV